METNRRVYFSGYYGMRNFGDDLFGWLCIEGAARWMGIRASLVGPPIAGSSVATNLPKVFQGRIYGSVGVIGKAARYLAFSRAINRATDLVLGGGSIINARRSFRRRMMMNSSLAKGVRLSALGVSIGPFLDRDSMRLAAEMLGHFSYVSVRDDRSYRLAREMGFDGVLHKGRDLAGLLPLLRPSPPMVGRDEDVETIGVALCGYEEPVGYPVPSKEVLIRNLVSALKRVSSSRRVRVLMLVLNEHHSMGDANLTLAVAGLLEQEGLDVSVIRYTSIPKILGAIEACDAVLSVRLHGAIAAFVQGVPFALVDYHPKCRDFADEVSLPMDFRVTHESCSAGTIFASLVRLLDRKTLPLLARSIYAAGAAEDFEQWAACMNPRPIETSLS